MKVTEELRQEHEAIKVFLKILGAASKRLAEGEKVDPEDLNWMFEFIKYFIDRCHHGKEEQVLFPAMMCMGMPENPVSAMVAEHEVAMSISKIMRGAAAGYGQRESWAVVELVDAAWRYSAVMDEHIAAEESLFYSIADSCFTNEMEQKIMMDFQKFELDRIGLGRSEELRELLNYLSAFYL